MVVMKATKHTHSKLIADVFVPEGSTYTYVNRRGNEMTVNDESVVMTKHVHDHYCYEHANSHEDETYRDRLAAIWAVMLAAVQSMWLKLPRLTPKKYTAEGGLQTDWKATLPPKSVLASSATLAIIALALNFAIWLQPQRTTPIVQTDPKPISATTVTQDREVLSVQNPFQSDEQVSPENTAWSPSGVAQNSTFRAQSPARTVAPATSSVNTSPAPVVTQPPAATTPEVVVPPVQQPEPPAPEVPTPTEPEPPIQIPIIPEVIDAIVP